MEFTLTYRGALKANGSVADKHAIRRKIHEQMKLLWEQRPLCQPSFGRWLEEYTSSAEVSVISRVGQFRFAPLVSSKIFLIAELNIAFLRPEAPGSLITQGGDIDNRLKTLLDALRMPKVPNELPAAAAPGPDENPYFCLLDDDNLITSLSVRTDQLLEPVASPAEVLLLIHVRTKVTEGTLENLSLG
jgi:hypothetical protein